ncbi:ABC transporter permease subunit, partial [Candidatus Uhrbacteria bacterium]|nr:ABC transporter permease subunit [Candidatus Uhrbacteria bacterium]
MAKKHFKIYQSRWHLLATLAFIAVPFLFLLSFSVVAKLSFQSIILDTVVSFWRVVVAYIISVVLAWACAMLFFQGKKSSVALPIFDVLQSIPTFAALPLAVAYWGPSNGTVILFLVFAIIWPIFFSVVSALKMVKRDWEEAVEMADLKGFHYIRYFLLPISIPSLITGSIIGLGDGWEALVATEMIV